MKIVITIALFLVACVSNVSAQLHYQMLGIVAGDFFQNRIDHYEVIPVVWNMEGTLQADLNDGINFILENHPVQAEGSLTIVIKKDATLWPARYYRAIARKQQANYTGAIEDLNAAVKLNPQCYEALVELARCYLATNSLEEGERAIKRAIQLDKNRAPAYFVKGVIAEGKGQTANAIKSFQQCLNADNRFHAARVNLAIAMLVVSKDEAGAIHELDSVLKLDSLQSHALALRSILVFEKNEQQSLHDLTTLIRVSPGNVSAFYLRGLLRTRLQDYDRAFSDFQTVIKSTATDDNNFEGQQTWLDKKIDIQNVGAYTLTRVYGLKDEDAAKLKQAYCLIVTNEFDKSITVLYSTSDLNEPLAVYLRAVACEHQGKHNQALFFYNEAIELDNTIADAYKKRGIYRQELQKWEESIEDFSSVLRLMPDLYVIYKIRGISYYHSKKFDNAIADFTSYIARDSGNIEVIGFRGACYRENKQFLKAYIDFANSGNSHAFHKEDMLHHVDSVLQKGDTTLAITALTSFINANRAFTDAHVLRLKVHARQKDWLAVERALADVLLNGPVNIPKQDRAYCLTLKGIVMSKTNRDEFALAAFDEAVRSDKNYAFAYLERGKYLLSKNKTSNATDDLKKAAALGNSEAKKLLEVRQ